MTSTTPDTTPREDVRGSRVTWLGGLLRLPWSRGSTGSETATGGPLGNRAESPKEEADAGSMGQLTLIRLAFARHRLAMWGLYALVLLYGVAILAEFVAIAPPSQRNVAYIHCPPQPVRFSLADGLHARALAPVVDPITLRRTYLPLADEGQPRVPLTLLARTEPYKLLGFIPLSHRLFGVDRPEWAGGVAGVEATFFPLGADKYGRCIFSRIVHGGRVSLSVGLLGVAMTFVLGTLIGGISGYAGGRADNLIQRGIEVVNAVPSLPLWIALGAAMPPDWSPLRTYFAITVVLSLLGWTGLARVVRGKILSLREEDYAVAARLLGASHGRVLVRHLLPGFGSHIIVALTLAVPGMILGETALSFLGLGLRPPVVSWGVMLQDCLDVKAVRFYPWLLLPAGVIVVTVLAFNFVGDGLRDAADPYSNK